MPTELMSVAMSKVGEKAVLGPANVCDLRKMKDGRVFACVQLGHEYVVTVCLNIPELKKAYAD